MPAIPKVFRDTGGGSTGTLPARRRRACSTARSLVSSSRRSSIKGSPGDSRSCTPALTDRPMVMQHQSQRMK